MNNKRIKSLTLTVFTESPVALSNDQGTGGNYTPVKKMFYKDGTHLFASVSTMTYELRKQLHEYCDWKMFDIKIKSKNLFNLQREDSNREADLFGYLVPEEQISRTSPLRIIPPVSVNKYRSDTQLITNRGFLNRDFERAYKNEKNEDIVEVQKTQALANEEIMGDYYYYTITIELDRIGRIETEKVIKDIEKDGKKKKKEVVEYLNPESYQYKLVDERKNIVKDVVKVLSQLTRTIKHQTVLLQPLAVFGGLFDKVIPYFSNSVVFNDNQIDLKVVKEVVDGYSLSDNSYLIKSINPKISYNKNILEEISDSPLKSLNSLIEYIESDVEINEEDNKWYLK